MTEHRRLKEWSRCSEGFSEAKTSLVKNGTRKPPVKRKSSETADFGHGNIFEKLFGGGTDDKSQSQRIDWSSSDEEGKKSNEAPPMSVQNKVDTPVQRLGKRQRTQPSPHSSRARRNKKMLSSKCQVEDVEIVQSSDGETSAQSQGQDEVTSSVKSTEAIIGGFDSDGEDTRADIKFPSQDPSSPEESQVTIATVESTSSVSPVSQVTTTPGPGFKASDWVKSLHLKTPSKSEQDEHRLEPEDSAKKKKKFTKGGMAEQLTRLQNRDKSAVRMWTHQQNKLTASQDSKSISLEVLSHETLYSMQLVRCCLCNQSKPGSTSNKDLSQTQDNSNKPGTSKASNKLGTSVHRKEDIRLVMFPTSQAEQLGLQTGSQIKISPPWQQLELNNGEQILLCTKYCQVLHGASSTEVSQTGALEDSGVKSGTKTWSTVKAKWNCPCVQGLCKNASLCPAYQFPAVAGLIQISSSGSSVSACSSSNSSTSALSTAPPTSTTSHLHTVSSRSDHMTTHSQSPRRLNMDTICDSLLKSIEGNKLAGESNQNSGERTVSFSGFVHRCIPIVEKNKINSGRYCLMVEDRSGTVCKMVIREDTLFKQNPRVTMSTMVHHTFQFKNLLVVERTTRDKDASLFSVIDGVWSGKCSVESQDSQQSQNQSGNAMCSPCPQSHCYVLTDEGSGVASVVPSPTHILTPSSPAYTPLSDLSSLGRPCRRCCVARLLYIHKQYGKLGSYTLYIADASTSQSSGYVRLPVSRDFHFKPEALSSATTCTVIELQDLFINHAGLRVDCYSQLKVVSGTNQPVLQGTVDELRSLSIAVKPVSVAMCQDDLCTVKGKIVEVDEDSAYSWEACVQCASDQLRSDHTTQKVQCVACNASMSEPVTRMKMEVVVQCDSPATRVRLDLLQPTIESLLPADEEDDEGYELSSVLHKQLGPIHCVVTAIQDSLVVGQQVQLLL